MRDTLALHHQTLSQRDGLFARYFQHRIGKGTKVLEKSEQSCQDFNLVCIPSQPGKLAQTQANTRNQQTAHAKLMNRAEPSDGVDGT